MHVSHFQQLELRGGLPILTGANTRLGNMVSTKDVSQGSQTVARLVDMELQGTWSLYDVENGKKVDRNREKTIVQMTILNLCMNIWEILPI
ncbi:hypothetical protein RchiOBHm_Chr4g0436351 [Rosa chinensis]|uniref:Uncharacterized protein n=1 Tax=Rosa chinensis TaxID=74649 RepID=A0A2P6R233_ROSCH|nr:hypothetical protein RchiOBHm_Chr4g0436351 [Rosa chinensis]